MNLADLKKQKFNKPKRPFTVEEFIEDANNYSLGRPELVTANLPAQDQSSLVDLAQPKARNSDKPFKHATFTLSIEVMSQLAELAEKTGISKSRLLRILIDDFYYQQDPKTLHLSKIK